MNKIIYQAVVGSRSYGTNIPTSDTDRKVIYVQPIQELLSFGYVAQKEVGKDETHIEVKRFLELLEKGNPGMMELLHTPIDCIEEISKEFEYILKHRDKFLTEKVIYSILGFAKDQLKSSKSLTRKMNWKKEEVRKKHISKFCYLLDKNFQKQNIEILNPQTEWGLIKVANFPDTYLVCKSKLKRGLFTDDSFDLRTISIKNSSSEPLYLLRFNKDGFSQHCKAVKEYNEWLKTHNETRIIKLDENSYLDGKNMLHCRRLIDMALEILTKKEFNVRRENAQFLKDVRAGKIDKVEFFIQIEKDLDKINELLSISDLPKEVNKEFLSKLLLKIRNLSSL